MSRNGLEKLVKMDKNKRLLFFLPGTPGSQKRKLKVNEVGIDRDMMRLRNFEDLENWYV